MAVSQMVQRTQKSRRSEHVNVDGQALYNACYDHDGASNKDGPLATTIICHIGSQDKT
jgi:hypothetical protein